MVAKPEELEARVTALARLEPGPRPVVSVYLNTRWSDEHHRDRVRVFLTRELGEARRAGAADEEDLRWVEERGADLVAQAIHPDARGVALFACGALGLREVLPLQVSVEEAFVVDKTPHLRPLVDVATENPRALVVFVDARSARLVPLAPGAAGDPVTLASEVPGHHRRGGWAQLAQSRYRRHLEEHRAQHLHAVTEAVAALVRDGKLEKVVLAGEPRCVAIFKEGLPQPVARLVVGSVAGTKHEGSSELIERARALLKIAEGDRQAAEIDTILTEAAKGGRAVTGIAGTLAAVRRGAIHRLYLARSFRVPGRACDACDALAPVGEGPCPTCGGTMKRVELGEAIVDRALAQGAEAALVDHHAGLEAHESVAARLRF
jgi:peptide subunit release factor 1 (eRF1)